MSNRLQAIIWTNDGLVYWCKYVSLDLNELKALENCLADGEKHTMENLDCVFFPSSDDIEFFIHNVDCNLI